MRIVLSAVAGVCLVGCLLWVRSAMFRRRFLRTVDRSSTEPEVRTLANSSLGRDVHAAAVYGLLALATGVAALVDTDLLPYLLLAPALPVLATVWMSRFARRDARLAYQRLLMEQRAHEVLTQEESAPRRWAERLAPSVLPDTDGFDVGTTHQAGQGVMSGDLLDVFRLPSGRLCCVVGDVSGHGVEASITALQVKFLLRSYLRRFRDPGQALEELNSQLIDLERPEEFVSLFVAIFDNVAGTVRYASAGHPAGWLCRERQPQALMPTGPVLMMQPDASYLSREREFPPASLLVLATDGLGEARDAEQLFGDERIAALVRRDADVAPQVLCKALVDEAVEFSGGTLVDDITVLAVRRA